MPYYGRGGAGNIQAATQEKERATSDPEAQLATAEEASPTPQFIGQDEQAYKRTGRGGAGNYHSQSDDVKLPVYEAEIDAASKAAPPPGEMPAKYGRGGAGNINFATGEKTERDGQIESEELKMKERVAKAVENYVGDELQVPEKAKLPGA